jgi:hypothetical protein
MPRRNKRDKRYEPKEYETNNGSYYDVPSQKQKPIRRRKGKWDKSIYKEAE